MPKTNNPVPIMSAPPANMYKAFDVLRRDGADIIRSGYRYVNRKTDYGCPAAPLPDPEKIFFSYFQPSQALMIEDKNINVRITCKYNCRLKGMENYGLVDLTFIRPIDGAPQGIGNGYLSKIGFADGTQISDAAIFTGDKKANEFIQSIEGNAREYTGHFEDALLHIHTDEDSGIPRTHDADILRPHTHDDIDDI